MIVKMKEINAKFTEVVSKYLAEGMTINVNTMNGSQGEIAKVHLTDGKSIYVVEIATDYNRDDKWHSFDTLALRVEKFDVKLENAHRAYTTLWRGNGEEIEKIEYFKIEEGVYTDSLAEIREIGEKQLKRWQSKDPMRNRDTMEIYIRPAHMETIVEMCRRHRGYSRIAKKNIEKIVKITNGFGNVSYKVVFLNDKDALVIKRREVR